MTGASAGVAPNVTEDTALLSELMLHAEMFCSRIEAAAKRLPVSGDQAELRLKIGQCRGALAVLQKRFDDDQLTVADPTVATDFRHLVMGLLWVSFQARNIVDRRLFGKLVQIESGFTYLLIASSRRADDEKS